MKPIVRFAILKVFSYSITLFASFTAVFFLFRLIPGDPIEMYVLRLRRQGMIYGSEAIREMAQVYIEIFGLDKDLLTQYVLYLRNLVTGNLGVSFVMFPTPVLDLIKQKLPWTIGLLAFTVVIAWTIGNLIGALISWKRENRFLNAFYIFSLIFGQIPYYFYAIILLLTLAYTLSLFPRGGAFSPGLTPSFNLEFILSAMYHAILPSGSILLMSICGWIISMRSLLVMLLNEDYLLFARAKGLKERRVFTRYALRNALLPQVTGLSLSLGFVVSGALIVENIFNYPGIGKLFMEALSLLDYNTAQACILLMMTSVLAASLIMDLLYPILDPRVA